MNNIDLKTINDFGHEWKFFDQTNLSEQELHIGFSQYFKIFPAEFLNNNNVGIDFGCGSGRWGWFSLIWKLSDYARRFISKLPFKIKIPLTQLIALIIY